MKCIVVTPEKTILNQDATFVLLPLADGEYGVLPNHAPLIARIGAGELCITGTDGHMTHYYLEGGFVEVLDDTIAVLSMLAVPVKDVDASHAKEQIAQEEASAIYTPELSGIRQEKIRNYRARVRVARKHDK